MRPREWTRPPIALVAAILAVGAVLATLFAVSRIFAVPPDPTVTTDKDNYYSNETVTVTGTDFTLGTSYDIPVIRPNGSIFKGDGSFTCPGAAPACWDTVVANIDEGGGQGGFTYPYLLDGIEGFYEVRVYPEAWDGDLNQTPLATTTFADASIDFKQCRNDSNNDGIDDSCLWTISNITPSNANYTEGDGVPQRLFRAITTSGSHYLEFEYDFSKSDVYAYDFLTSPAYTVGANLDQCGELPGAFTGLTTSSCNTAYSASTSVAVPSDLFDDVALRENPAARSFKLGCIPTAACSGFSITFPNLDSGSVLPGPNGNDASQAESHVPDTDPDCIRNCGNSSARFRVNFSTTSGGVVAAVWFAGHLGEDADPLGTAIGWGPTNCGSTDCGASSITAVPFYMKYLSLDGNTVGGQNNEISAAGVETPGFITIVKDAVPDNAQDFSFTGSLGAFTLDDDGVAGNPLSNSSAFTSLTRGTYNVSETLPGGWGAPLIACIGDTDGGSVVSSPGVAIDLDSGENITCTFTNQLGTASTDVKIVSQTVFAANCTSAAPTSIPVSQNTTICVRKVIHNNGPFGPVNVSISKTASAPNDCTVTPSGAINSSESTLQVSVDRIHDELFVIHCTQPSFHQFAFTNSIFITTPGVLDTNSSNNSASTNFTPSLSAQFDLKVVSQTIGTPNGGGQCVNPPPTQMIVSQNTDICVHKVIHNNGPFGPIDAIDTNVVSFLPPDCTANPPEDTELIFNLPVSLDITFDEFFTIHCTASSFHTFSFTNTLSPVEHTSDSNPSNDTLTTNIIIPVINFTDVQIVSQQVLSGPAELKVSEDGQVTIRKVIRNNGPLSPVDVEITKLFDPPPDCNAIPPDPVVEQFTLVANTPVTVDEVWTIHCFERSFHTFHFINEIAPKDPHIQDSNTGNNSANSPFVFAAIDDADVRIVSQTVFAADCASAVPATIPVSQNTNICLRKVIVNDGPFGPVDVSIAKTASAPADCTIIPSGPIAGAENTLQVGVLRNHDEIFTIHCTTPSFHQFSFTNDITLVPLTHVTDPNTANNSADTDFTRGFTTQTDVRIVSQAVFAANCASAAPTSIPVSQNTTICLHKVIRNAGPFGPVDVSIAKTAAAPPDCTITPSGPIAGVETNLQVNVDRNHDELFTIHCTTPSFHQFSFTNSIAITTVHVLDSNLANNSANTNVSPAFTAQADARIVSQAVFAADCASAAPTSIPTSQNTTICVRKVIRNAGPAGPIDVSISKTATAPADCTIAPSGPIAGTETNLQVNVDRNHDELFVVHCTKPSFHQFSFTNSISITTLHVTDSNPANNSMNSNVQPAFTAQADAKIVSQTVFGANCTSPPPAVLSAPSDTTICLRKVIHNNGPYGPVDVSVAKTATFVPAGSQLPSDASITPTSGSASLTALVVSTDVTHDEIFTIHCSVQGNFTFVFTNEITVEVLHVSDGVPSNDSKVTQYVASCGSFGGIVEFRNGAEAPLRYDQGLAPTSGSPEDGRTLIAVLAIAVGSLGAGAGLLYARRRLR